MSINVGKPGGGPGDVYDIGGTTATEVLAVVIVMEAMVAKLMVGGIHSAGPWLGVWRGTLVHLHLSPIPKQ